MNCLQLYRIESNPRCEHTPAFRIGLLRIGVDVRLCVRVCLRVHVDVHRAPLPHPAPVDISSEPLDDDRLDAGELFVGRAGDPLLGDRWYWPFVAF